MASASADAPKRHATGIRGAVDRRDRYRSALQGILQGLERDVDALLIALVPISDITQR
jgi:hypothetical protein